MRISTKSIFEAGAARMSELQSNIAKANIQMTSGKRILEPSDDPIGAARALVLNQSNDVIQQFGVNRRNAENTLSITEGVLGSITGVLQNIKNNLVTAGGGVLSDQDRNFIANELESNLNSLLGLANSTDGTENYLFSGYNSLTTPYTKTANGAKYNGDQGLRILQVDTSRQIPVSDVGQNIFGNIRTSNSTFNVRPFAGNAGGAVVTAAINTPTSANLTGDNYSVEFDGTGANFFIRNLSTGAVAVPTTAYASPQTVTVDGMDITITNTPTAPGAGDKFTIQSGNQNIFQTITDAINGLRTPTAGNINIKKEMTLVLEQADKNLEKSLSNVLLARTNVGSSLKEIETLNSAGESMSLAYKKEISSIEDLDYVKAITELNQNQMVLQAAQQSYVKATSLSLFNYIN